MFSLGFTFHLWSHALLHMFQVYNRGMRHSQTLPGDRTIRPVPAGTRLGFTAVLAASLRAPCAYPLGARGVRAERREGEGVFGTPLTRALLRLTVGSLLAFRRATWGVSQGSSQTGSSVVPGRCGRCDPCGWAQCPQLCCGFTISPVGAVASAVGEHHGGPDTKGSTFAPAIGYLLTCDRRPQRRQSPEEPTLMISSCLRVRDPGTGWADAPGSLLRLHPAGWSPDLGSGGIPSQWGVIGRSPLPLGIGLQGPAPSLRGSETAPIPSRGAAPAWQLASSEAGQSAGKMEATACGLIRGDTVPSAGLLVTNKPRPCPHAGRVAHEGVTRRRRSLSVTQNVDLRRTHPGKAARGSATFSC